MCIRDSFGTMWHGNERRGCPMGKKGKTVSYTHLDVYKRQPVWRWKESYKRQ